MEENRGGRRKGVRGTSFKEEHDVSLIQEVLCVFYRLGTVLNNKITEKCALKLAFWRSFIFFVFQRANFSTLVRIRSPATVKVF